MFTDGGVIGRNPSKLGGTWCFLWVVGDSAVRQEYGVVEPEDIGLPAVTNNVTELIAAVRALKTVHRDWDGTLYTDSQVTLLRITDGKRFSGVPACLERQARELREGRKYKVGLLAGHPTREHLRRGLKGTRPVSKYNVACDTMCGMLAEEYGPLLAGRRAS